MIRPNCLESDSVASGPQWKVASANKAAPRYDLPGYAELLSDLKNRIARARIAARTAVNREIIFLYWQIGHEILARQKELGWGAKVIDRLSVDLRHAFPEASGFSSRNLKYMRRFAAAYEEEEFVQQVVAQIPWGHHDLPFYHLRLRCFVAVELKVGPFQPEHAGKMNFYLCALDEHLRRDDDEPSIGLILCKERNRVVVEYALRGSNRPIGVAAYRLTSTLPPGLRGSLPSPEELQRGLESGG
jgi:predicted nuclease of restriction endonuclease-like (RecB) superfamily